MGFFKLLLMGRLGWICRLTKKHKWERYLIIDIEPLPIDPMNVSWSGKECLRCGISYDSRQ